METSADTEEKGKRARNRENLLKKLGLPPGTPDARVDQVLKANFNRAAKATGGAGAARAARPARPARAT